MTLARAEKLSQLFLSALARVAKRAGFSHADERSPPTINTKYSLAVLLACLLNKLLLGNNTSLVVAKSGTKSIQ